jgi:low temperature requirement protein LtrA
VLANQRRLSRAAEGREQNTLARDAYSLLHFPMVAGIILIAFGLEEALLHTDLHLHSVPAFALTGGTALYLLAHVALRLRGVRNLSYPRLITAAAVLALWPVALEISALAAVAAVNVLLWAMIAYETRMYGQARYRLRHGLEPEPEPAAS